jgi:ribonuclease P protein component
METNQDLSSKKFPKQERLTSKKTIEELFTKGSSVFVYPYRVLYLPRHADTSVHIMYPQVLFSVSKKNFKKAVDRNLIKRRMREAYRLNKPAFLQSTSSHQLPYTVAFVYVAKEKIEFAVLEKKLKSVWHRLVNSYNESK